MLDARVQRGAQARTSSRQRARPALQPRQTVGWSGKPTENPDDGERHLALIQRGLDRVGPGRIDELNRRLQRMIGGDPRLRRVRASAASRQTALSVAVARSRGRSPHVDELQAKLERSARALDDVDRQLTQQKTADHVRAAQVMTELRRSLMTARPEPEARAMAEALTFAPSALRYRSLVVSVATDFFRLMSVPLAPEVIRIHGRPEGRARSSPDGTIFLAAPDAAQVLHELGHLAEYASPDLYAAALGWRSARSRASGDGLRLRALSEIDPEAGYQRDEMAIEDEFFDPYVGAVYERLGLPTTEVLTTGLQHFDRGAHMLDLFARDPEHFMFIVGAMQDD